MLRTNPGHGLQILEGFFFNSHTQRSTTVGRISLDEGSVRRRNHYLITHARIKETNAHYPCGIGNHNPSRRASTDPHLTRRGCWDRPIRCLSL